VDGQTVPGAEALRRRELWPARLSYKDGLALINGTSFMTGLLSIAVTGARTILKNYLAVSALSFGCLGARRKPIDPVVHALKGHVGQRQIASELYRLLADMEGVVDDEVVSRQLSDERIGAPREGSLAVEDPYSLRCSPQILGPVLDTIQAVEASLENEINSSNDNPLVDLETEEVYHCGHFHGQYVAMAADQLKIALTTLANLADRRIDRLLDAKKNGVLKPFLADADAGVRLGLMGAQFMACSLVSEMRSTSHPTSIQSLPSTADFQDIVSLGLVASRQALDLTEKCAYVVGCELLLGCQVIDLKGFRRIPREVSALYNALRAHYPFRDADRSLTHELDHAQRIVLGRQ
jgi:histidine ammonia-lyase